MKAMIHSLGISAIIVIAAFFFRITGLKAQDYLISFAGSGASTTVDSVKIENLTQGTKLKMKGSDVLHLMGVTGIETITGDVTGNITFYPNPMKDFARMQFVLPTSGVTLLTLYDISGRIISQTREFLSAGKHTFRLQGIKEGIYFVRVNNGKYSCTGRLISSGSQTISAGIIYENTVALKEKQIDSKGTNEEVVMQYTTGSRLLIKGISGNYCTIITDVPSASKTITFNFVACTDGSNNNYPVVVIGTQTWMGENLRTRKYYDGVIIPKVMDNTTWKLTGSPAFCWYNNDSANFEKPYGRLYKWYTVSSGKLCPSGWHVPTDADWTILSDFLVREQGGKLKETGSLHWAQGNVGATNETGFTGVAGGCRTYEGFFSNWGNIAYFMSSTESDANNAYYWNISTYNTYFVRSSTTKGLGYSVRCIKN